MTDDGSSAARRVQIIDSLVAFGAAQSELLRVFARRNDMHPSDAAAVVQIIEHEEGGRPLTPARLAHLIGLTPGATSILLSRLEAAGAIHRSREQADRRVVTLRSTTAINEAADAFFEPLTRELDGLLATSTRDEIEIIAVAAARLSEAVQRYVRDVAVEAEG